jgi:hypothetical protein
MRQQTRALKEPAEKVVQDIRRATRKHYSAEALNHAVHHEHIGTAVKRLVRHHLLRRHTGSRPIFVATCYDLAVLFLLLF